MHPSIKHAVIQLFFEQIPVKNQTVQMSIAHFYILFLMVESPEISTDI